MNWHVGMRVGLLVAVLCTAACSDKDDPGTTDDPGAGAERPGMGVSTKPPEGAPFSLPAGVEWINPIIKSYNAVFPEKCHDKKESDGRGSGDLVRLCLALRNTTTQIIHVSFPSGMIFISESLDVQNGILIQGETVELPPGQDFYVPLFMYCLNPDRTGSFPDDEFRPGPITQYKDFQDFFAQLANKKLPLGSMDLQHAVWNLADGIGLDEKDRTTINGLGPK
ncbi:hypothetical protein DRW03_29840 [Corallococcus sp. H22C18031201]|nr:hypothetical protein DRW03_29840 [Corallococcus sp. H22C18031201]